MARITEIAEDVFQISTLIPAFDLRFNQFLVRDEQPLLYHTGMRSLFPEVREAVATLIDPARLRWIGGSHFEPDECGSLNEWLAGAPQAEAVTSEVGAGVFLGDFASRPPRALPDDAVLSTGKRRFRLRHTPHFPHGWDAMMLFEETTGVLFCSDLLHQIGDVEAATEASVIDRFRNALVAYQKTPLANYMPYTPNTEPYAAQLAALRPRVCATMHGSAYRGDGARVLREMAAVIKEVFGPR